MKPPFYFEFRAKVYSCKGIISFGANKEVDEGEIVGSSGCPSYFTSAFTFTGDIDVKVLYGNVFV